MDACKIFVGIVLGAYLVACCYAYI